MGNKGSNLFSNNDSKLLEKSLLLQKSNIKGVNLQSNNNNNKTNIMTSNKSNIIYSPSSSNKNNTQNKQTINRSDYLNNNKQSPK